MTSQEKFDSIDALFKQAEAELDNQKLIVDLDLYNNNLNQTELKSTTIKTVHAIHSVKKSLSVNASEAKSREEIRKSQSITQEFTSQSERSVQIRKRISDLYELSIDDDNRSIDQQGGLSTDNPNLLNEKQNEISATMAEIAHTVKAIPTVQDQKLSKAEEIFNQDFKSQVESIVEPVIRDIIKNEMQHILDGLLKKQLGNKSRLTNTKVKKTQSKKTQSKKTQSKKTQSKKTQAKKTQSKKTQAKKTQTKKTQSKKTQSKKTQARIS